MGQICAPGNVTVPCENKSWSLGIQGLYLNTVNGATRGYRSTSFTTVDNISNAWDWGTRAEGSYQFHQGNDVTINWLHLTSNQQQEGFSTTFSPVLTASYTLSKKDQFDVVNLAVGQKVDVGIGKKLRFYGGLQYANAQEYTTNYYASVALGTFSAQPVSIYDNADFRGAGPLVGMDYSYELVDNLSLVANGEAAVLYGTSRYSTGTVLTDLNAVLSSLYASQKTIITGFEAKLGVDYGYNMPEGKVNLQAGYQVIDYPHLLQKLSGPSTSAGQISYNNLGLYGPYLGLKYTGNA